ncbi:DUF4962 domain-containing protein [Gemmatimonadota bacterium]
MLCRCLHSALFVFFIFPAVPAELRAAPHPSLYFSASDISNLKKQARTTRKIQFSRLQHWCDTHLTEAPPAEIGMEERHHESCFSAISNYGIAYQITGDGKYLAAGRRWIEALLETSTDGSGEFVTGTFCAALAHGYDFFYNGLPANIRNDLKDKLIAVLEEVRYGASTSWWRGIYTHHDFWIPIAFMGVGALCLDGEYGGADSIVNFVSDELDKALSLLGDEGYWPEGVADWVYGMVPAVMYFDALERSGRRDFYRNKWLENTMAARLMHWLPGDRYMYIGDSFPSGRYGGLGSVSGHLSMRLSARYRDPQAQWLALREALVDSTAPEINSLENPYSYATAAPVHDRERHGLAWQFLWYDPSLESVTPESLPVDKLYHNWDTAIMRSGWSDDDPVVAFCGGHLLGRAGTAAWKAGMTELPGGLAHTHQNAGAIYVWADGRFPLKPPAFGGRDGRFHSTVMVNGHGQYFDPDYTGRITAWEAAGDWSMATLDLSSAYPPDVSLAGFTRTIVYLKPRTLVVFDRLHGGGDNYLRRYEWLLHTDPDSADWQYRDDTIQAVSRESGDPWLIGRVFPSYRYYFEKQSLDRPDGKPVNRALSVTVIGRMPSRIDIASMLHFPAKDEDTGWLHRVSCVSGSGSTTMMVPDGPYFVIRTGPKGKPTRSVVFATADTVEVPREVPEAGLLLVAGLKPDTKYRAEGPGEGTAAGYRLFPDDGGELETSSAGNLTLRK